MVVTWMLTEFKRILNFAPRCWPRSALIRYWSEIDMIKHRVVASGGGKWGPAPISCLVPGCCIHPILYLKYVSPRCEILAMGPMEYLSTSQNNNMQKYNLIYLQLRVLPCNEDQAIASIQLSTNFKGSKLLENYLGISQVVHQNKSVCPQLMVFQRRSAKCTQTDLQTVVKMHESIYQCKENSCALR